MYNLNILLIISGGDKGSEKSVLVKKTSYQQIQGKVSAIKQRLELKTHTKQEIFDKYTAQKPKQRSKPKVRIMADNGDGNVNASKFKNIRMMFESNYYLWLLRLTKLNVLI